MDNKYLLELCDAAENGKVILHIEGTTKDSSQLFKGSGAVGEFHHTGEGDENFYEFDADELKKSVTLREEIFSDLLQTGQKATMTDI